MKQAFNKAKTATVNFYKKHEFAIGTLIGVAVGVGAPAAYAAYKDRRSNTDQQDPAPAQA